MDENRFKKRSSFLIALPRVCHPAGVLDGQHVFKTNEEILSSLLVLAAGTSPGTTTSTIFTDVSWYSGYINSLIYVAINTVISLVVALPAAYAFSRYSFLGDKHVFFWLLTNRMTPPAVFLLPFFQLYTTLGLMDTHIAVALAHLLFNVPLAVWILEGFMSGIPREIDETAYIDGYSFPRFFLTIFIPLIKAGVGVAAFFCFMFSWVELLMARTLTSVNAKPIVAVMTRTVSASGMDWGVLAAAGVLTIVPGAIVIWFVRNYIAKGFAMGAYERTLSRSLMFEWMAWTTAGGGVLQLHRADARRHDGVGDQVAHVMRKGFLPMATTRGDRLFIGLLSAAYLNLAFVAVSERMIEWLAWSRNLRSGSASWLSMAAAGAGHAARLKFFPESRPGFLPSRMSPANGEVPLRRPQ
jgi:glycerol transport system permease protein